MAVWIIIAMLIFLSFVVPTATSWLSIRLSFEDFLAFAGIVATVVLTSAVADFASHVRLAGSSAQRAHFSAVSVFPEIAATVAAFGLDVAGLLCMLSLLVIEWGSQASLARYLVVIVVCVAVSMFASLRPSFRAGNLLPRNLARQRTALDLLRQATARRRELVTRVSKSPLPSVPRSVAVTGATVVVAILPGLIVARSTSPAESMVLATFLSVALPVNVLAIWQGVFGPGGKPTAPIIGFAALLIFVTPMPLEFTEVFGGTTAGYDVMPSIVAWTCSAALLSAAYWWRGMDRPAWSDSFLWLRARN